MIKKIPVISFVLFLLDQLFKYLIISKLNGDIIINKLMCITYVKNYGISFGMFNNMKVPIIIVSIIILFFLIKTLKEDFIKKKDNRFSIMISFSLLFAGLFGNLIDRIFRGYVVDYISVKYFSVFNLADIFITLGVFMLLYDMVFKKKKGVK